MANTNKLTHDVHDRIINLLAQGNFIDTAACAVGLHPRTLREWITAGERGNSAYAKFASDVREAQAWAEIHDLAKLREHGETQWQALTWRLERKDPKKFGLRVRVEVNEALDEILAKLERNLTVDEYRRVLEVIASDDTGAPTLGDVGGVIPVAH